MLEFVHTYQLPWSAATYTLQHFTAKQACTMHYKLHMPMYYVSNLFQHSLAGVCAQEQYVWETVRGENG